MMQKFPKLPRVFDSYLHYTDPKSITAISALDFSIKIKHNVASYELVESICLEETMKEKKAADIFRECGGQMRMIDAIGHGITRYMLYKLRDEGVIEQITRGAYRLSELPQVSNPDLVTVSLRFPKAIICLVSALAYYDLTTQIPHSVSIAIPREARVPSLDNPPITAHRFSKMSYQIGIEEHRIDNVPIRIYNPEKTLTDCFKFRNKLGMDVVLEALKLYKSRRKSKINEILEYARTNRVEKVMRPYLEASL